MPKAYSYIRFSTPEQAKGDSYRRQLALAKRYAAEHNLDLVTDAEYRFFDPGVSAYKGKNRSDSGNLRRFNEYVKSGKISAGSYLLVESLDRISREQVSEALESFLSILNSGICLVTISDNMVYKKNPDITQLIVSILHMARAHSESKHKGERVSEAWQEKQNLARTSGKPLGAACPYWLELFDGNYRANPEKAAVVKRIFELSIKGHGKTSISKILNEEGVPVFGSTKRNKSQLWGTSSIDKILSNRSTIGEYQPMRHINGKRAPYGDPIKDYYPKVITEEIFYSALAATKKRLISKATKQSKNFNVWSKIAKCSICKSPMHLVNKGPRPKGGVYLRCAAGVKGKCASKSIRRQHADIAFKETLAKLNSTPLTKEPNTVLTNKLSVLEGRQHNEKDALSRLADLLYSTPSDTLANLVSAKESEIEQINQEIEETRQQITNEKIFDKDLFFEKLDLESYEGRATANSFLQHNNVHVKMNREMDESIFTVTINEKPFLGIVIDNNDKSTLIPLSISSLESIVNQADLPSTEFPYTAAKMLSLITDEETAQISSQADTVNLKTYTPKPDPERARKLLRSLGLDE